MAPKQEYPVIDSAKCLNWWRSKEPIRTVKVEKWTPTDGNGQKPQRTGQGIANDLICADWKTLITTHDPFENNLEYDPPVFVKLTDWLVYFLVHVTHPNERAAHWHVDFNVDGNSRA